MKDTGTNMKRIGMAAIAAFATLAVQADTHVWKGGGDTKRWSDATNWEENEAPAAGDIARIPSGATAWASHFADPKGDLTLIQSLASIDLVAVDSVFEMDSEGDRDVTTAKYAFSTPVTGLGVCKFSNGYNDSGRHVSLTADNTAFQGTFHFYQIMAWVDHIHALGTTNLVKWETANAWDSLYFHVAGTYYNPIDHYGNSSYPKIGGNCGQPVVLAGRLTNRDGGTMLPDGDNGNTTFVGGIDNGSNGVGSCRIQGGARIAGEGIMGNARLYNGETAHLGALANGAFMAAGGTLICEADNVLKGCTVYTADPGSGTLDLNGHDQAPTSFNFQSMTEEKGSTTVVTSSVPAKLSISGLASGSTWYEFWGHIQGYVSVEFTGGSNTAKIPFANSNNTKGELTITNKGMYEFLSTCSFSNVKRIAILDGTSKYSTTKLLFHTAAINPKFVLDLNGAYAIANIDDGIQLQARWCKIGGKYLEPGVYGSQAAHNAYPELVDADHVLANLEGLGTLSVARKPRGLVIAVH